jgi:Na+-driven multidrug efflux pump/anti-sigma regulatory factor (Ser/Thr protein kinase)
MSKKESGLKLLTRLFFRLLPAQIMLLVISAVNDIISSLFASNYIGAEAMSAVGLYAPINTFILAVSLIFVSGSQILCGKYMGRNEIENTQRIFSVNLLMVIGFSGITIAILLLGSLTELTRILAPDAVVREALNRYILGKLIGILPLLLGQQITAFLSLENRTKIATIASVVFMIINLALNFLFVSVLKMGEFGLALAPSAGMWIFLAIELQYYFSGKSMLKLSTTGVRIRDTWDIIKTGFPGAINNGYQAVRGFIVNALIIQFVGSVGLSAFAASDSVLQIIWRIPGGMLAVSRMLMSISIGEEDRKSLADVMRIALFKCVPLMACISAVLIALAVPLTRLFFRDPTDPVYEMTIMAFRILPLCMPLSVICMQFSCYAQASGKHLLIHLLSLLDGLVCVAGFSAILIRPMGINGVYVSNICNGIICALVIVLYSWIVRKAFPRNIEQLMVIPDDFGVPEDARIDITVRNIDEVMTVSQQVIDFCHRRGIDGRTAYFSGLFLEEMAANVVEHGFNKDNKSHSVDIRVVHKNDDVILRIKDDCIPFDPAERQEFTDPKDRARGAGIRMVYKGAKDIKYQNILGLNVLTIRL